MPKTYNVWVNDVKNYWDMEFCDSRFPDDNNTEILLEHYHEKNFLPSVAAGLIWAVSYDKAYSDPLS